jgi:hypothetical protein
MDAQDEIDSLNDFLADNGQEVRLSRYFGTVNQSVSSVSAMAFVRDYKPNELTAGIIQGDSLAYMSSSEIDAVGWPGGIEPQAGDARVPVKGDRILINGIERGVESCSPVYIGEVLVRLNIQVRG